MYVPPPVEISLAAAEFLFSFAGLYIQLRDRRQRKPCFRKHTIPIVRPLAAVSDLMITYRGEIVDDLSLTELFFWNDGRGTFEERDLDVGEEAKLRVTTNGKIFTPLRVAADVKNGVEVHHASDATLIADARVTFKFLDPGEGWVLTIKHSGDVDLKGAFRNAEDLKHKQRPTGIAILISMVAAFAFVMAELFYLAGSTTVVLFYCIVAQIKNPAPAKFRKFLATKGAELPFP